MPIAARWGSGSKAQARTCWASIRRSRCWCPGTATSTRKRRRVVSLSQAGEREKALQLFQGGYRHASNQVTLLLKELRRGLGQ